MIVCFSNRKDSALRQIGQVALFGAMVFFPSHNVKANVNGSDHQNFNPAAGRYDYVSVTSPQTQKKGYLHLGLYLNSAVNTLPYGGEESSRDSAQDFNDTVTGLDLQVMHGLHDNWDISFTIPYVIHQTVKNQEEYHGEFKKMGNTELRLQNKFKLIDTGASRYGLLATVNYNRTINNPYSGNKNWTAFGLEALGEWQWSQLRLGANLGYRWRPEAESVKFDDQLISEVFDDQLLASLALGVPIPNTDLEFISELYSGKVLSEISSISGRESWSAEALMGAKWKLPHDYMLNFGYSRELRHSVSSANHRAFIGLTWLTPLRPFKSAFQPKASTREFASSDKAGIEAAKKSDTAAVEKEYASLSQGIFEPRKHTLGSANTLKIGGLTPSLLPGTVQERAPDRLIRLSNVLFAFDSDQLNGMKAHEDLARVAGVLSESDLDYVEVAGHTCSLGDSMYNQELSERRTQTIVKVLVGRYGIPREKIIPVGYGELFPLTNNHSETFRALNRRVEFRIFYSEPISQQSLTSNVK